VLRRDAHDSLCPCLVDTRDLVEEYEREFVFLISDLDHIAVDRVQGVGDIDGNLVGVVLAVMGVLGLLLNVEGFSAPTWHSIAVIVVGAATALIGGRK